MDLRVAHSFGSDLSAEGRGGDFAPGCPGLEWAALSRVRNQLRPYRLGLGSHRAGSGLVPRISVGDPRMRPPAGTRYMVWGWYRGARTFGLRLEPTSRCGAAVFAWMPGPRVRAERQSPQQGFHTPIRFGGSADGRGLSARWNGRLDDRARATTGAGVFGARHPVLA